MGLTPEEWVEVIKAHPYKYQFDGLRGWYKDVREACVCDERFMGDWMEREREGMVEALVEELKSPPPKDGEEDDWCIEDYAQFLRGQRWHAWEEPENMNLAPARKVIEKLEPKQDEQRQHFGTRTVNADSLRFDWSCERGEPSEQWDYIKQDEPEYYLKEHPPVQIYSEDRGTGIDIDDVYAFCPGCDGIILEEEAKKSSHFLCGYCGYGDTKISLAAFVEKNKIRVHPFEEEITNVEDNVREGAA